jgi:Phage tail lysozyme
VRGPGFALKRRMHRSTTLAPLALSLLVLVTGCASGGDVTGGRDDQGAEAITESGNDKTAFDFFLAKGLTPVQCAGIVGNLDQESGMDPTIYQYDNGPGRGIAQWSAGERWDTTPNANVLWYAGQMGESEWSENLQLEFIWWELTNEGYGFSDLTAATTVEDAVGAFQDEYEICGQCDASNRVAHAYAALQQFGGDMGGDPPHPPPPPPPPPPQDDPNCDVHSDGKLYCGNSADAAMYASDNFSSGVVNTLRSTDSWFTCWGTGEQHAGGNTTWYYTLGDDNDNWGWIPAVDLNTTSDFDADPSAHGLARCN